MSGPANDLVPFIDLHYRDLPDYWALVPSPTCTTSASPRSTLPMMVGEAGVRTIDDLQAGAPRLPPRRESQRRRHRTVVNAVLGQRHSPTENESETYSCGAPIHPEVPSPLQIQWAHSKAAAGLEAGRRSCFSSGAVANTWFDHPYSVPPAPPHRSSLQQDQAAHPTAVGGLQASVIDATRHALVEVISSIPYHPVVSRLGLLSAEQ